MDNIAIIAACRKIRTLKRRIAARQLALANAEANLATLRSSVQTDVANWEQELRTAQAELDSLIVAEESPEPAPAPEA